MSVRMDLKWNSRERSHHISGSTCSIFSIKMGSILNEQVTNIPVIKVRPLDVPLFVNFDVSIFKSVIRTSPYRWKCWRQRQTNFASHKHSSSELIISDTCALKTDVGEVWEQAHNSAQSILNSSFLVTKLRKKTNQLIIPNIKKDFINHKTAITIHILNVAPQPPPPPSCPIENNDNGKSLKYVVDHWTKEENVPSDITTTTCRNRQIMEVRRKQGTRYVHH